jgi:flagellar biosynthesis GTPase FlhF
VKLQLDGERKGVEDLLKRCEAERDCLRSECDEWRRKCTTAESRCKILELEADRPRWEQAKKKREKMEKEEMEKAEARRRQAEVEESQRKMREFLAEEQRRMMEEKMERAREEAERRARMKEEQERLEKKRREEETRRKAWRQATTLERCRCRQRDITKWGSGRCWTKNLALVRFIFIADEFDKAKFSEALPLTFENVPWPVCEDPVNLLAEDIDWGKVEAFFGFAKSSYTKIEFRRLVEKAHRMFHPDKWRARRVFQTVLDDDLRKSLEDAVNTVSQAVTPLWRQSKGYD